MNTKNIIVALFCFSIEIISSNLAAQEHEFRVSLENISVDSLIIYGYDVETKKMKIYGEIDGSDGWKFTIPDSIYRRNRFFRITSESFNYQTRTQKVFSIYCKEGQDTTKYFPLYFDEKYPEIHLQYIGNEISVDDEQNTIIDYKFLIECKEDQELYISRQYQNFSSFVNSEKSYEEQLEEYKDIASEYPDSRYLITYLWYYYENYKSKDDIKQVFNHFSEKNKQTYFGQWLNHYLFTQKIGNKTLPNAQTNESQLVIEDSLAYNLLIFSASWCSPCHKQIPTLKEIYQDLNEYIHFTYISIDEPKSIDSWKQLIQKETIPWRSLLAGYDLSDIKEEYSIQSIPLILLVYPGGAFEEIDVMNAQDRGKLYKLFQHEISNHITKR